MGRGGRRPVSIGSLCLLWSDHQSCSAPGSVSTGMGDRIGGLTPGAGNLSWFNQPAGSTQPGHLSVCRRNEYRPKGGDALRLRSKDTYGSCLLAAKTVWFLYDTCHIWALQRLSCWNGCCEQLQKLRETGTQMRRKKMKINLLVMMSRPRLRIYLSARSALNIFVFNIGTAEIYY